MSKGLKRVMALSYSGYNSQIKLSPEEMLEISQEINHEHAPELSIENLEPASQYPLSPKEMLAISEEIRQDFAPKASDNTQELVLLPVDPDHIYAYWNLGDDQPDTAQKIDSGNQLTLRIYPESDKNADITVTKLWFDVAISGSRSQQNVPIPLWAHETTYRATIGKRDEDNSLAPLATSNLNHVPLGKVMPNQVMENQLVFTPMLQSIAAGRETAPYMNKSASGQGNNQ